MTRKDYNLIAAAIREVRNRECADTGTCSQIAYTLAAKLKHENPRFKHDKFLNACGCQNGF